MYDFEADLDGIALILKSAKIIAVVGLSDNRRRPSYRVAVYMKNQGYTIIPVSPVKGEILGEKSYKSLSEIPCKVDIVDVFRRSDAVPEIADEAIRIGAGALWLQEGVIHERAGLKAHQAGIKVVMDRCIKKMHKKLV